MDQSARLPTMLTPFFGRKAEMQAIRALLADPACRLLTLTGPGGMGKTRLALEAARAALPDYADGVYFIDLQSLPSGEMLPLAICDALAITRGQDGPLDHLLRFLAERQTLLVLDNFEQLLEAAELLTHLLLRAPGVALMVTSREALNLREEWLYPVGGIDLPAAPNGSSDWHETARATSAVQLFAACAARVQPAFSLDGELEHVVEICRLVEGMPLAIELAASWARMLRCEIIAREIKENIHFLASGLRNIPERHRSILAVFESTWRMLQPPEQQAFMRMSVFRGGFDQAAAAAVAETSLPVMLALIDKSLLRQVANGEGDSRRIRFSVHEILRQFAHDALAQNEDARSHTHDRHAAYYLRFLQQRNDDLLGARQVEAVREIHAELENIRAAWQWAAEQGQADLLREAVQALDAYFQYQSRFREGADLFEHTMRVLDRHEASENRLHTQAQLWACLGWYGVRLGAFEQASRSFETARNLYERIHTPPPDHLGSDPPAGLAVLAVLRGDYAAAVALGEQVIENSRLRGHDHNLTFAHYMLAGARLAQGDSEAASRHAQEACSRSQQAGNDWMLAYSLNEWGHSLCALGDLTRARQLYQQSYHIRQSLNDPEGMALALNHLGKVALMEADYAEATRCFRESCAIYTTIFDRGGLSTALNGLGSSALGLGKLAEARDSLSRALLVAREIRFVPLIAAILVPAGELFIRAGLPERGVVLLDTARYSAASSKETRSLAEEAVARLPGARLDLRPSGASASPAADLDELAHDLLVEMENLTLEAPAQPPNPTAAGEDALSLREVEILRWMDAGLTNQAIADQLVISIGTVKWYTSQIYAKMQVASRTQALAKARAMGIL